MNAPIKMTETYTVYKNIISNNYNRYIIILCYNICSSTIGKSPASLLRLLRT